MRNLASKKIVNNTKGFLEKFKKGHGIPFSKMGGNKASADLKRCSGETC